MHKGLFFIAVLWLVSCYSFAQRSDLAGEASSSSGTGLVLEMDSLNMDAFPLHDYGFEVGASVFTNFNKGYGFNTYVAPRFSLQPARKFRMDMFASVGRTSFYNMPVWGYYGNVGALDQSMLSLGMYAQATYSINPRLYVGGAGFIDYLMPENTEIGPAMQNLTNYGGKTYVGYKFSDSFSMEAGFGVSKYPTYPVSSFYGGYDPGYHWRK